MGDCVAGPPSTVLWQASGPPLLHQLPEDVLRHIASKVSTREWAQIAPTCTVLQRLQPTSLTVATSPWIMNRGVPGHVPSVFLWTSRHLKAASKLDLTMHPAGSGPNRIWKHLCKDVVGTFPTQMLRASLVSSIVFYRKMHAHQRRMLDEHISSGLGYSPATDLEECAAWLAWRMPALQTLSLFVSACPALPALSQLRHIEIQALDFSDMNDNLQQMPRLKTALLTCMHMEARIPVLALSALLCLEHLSLQDVYPEQLSIPPACRLDVHGEAQGIQQSFALCLMVLVASPTAVSPPVGSSFRKSSVHLQSVGQGWEQALAQLHTCTCAWTIMRKTGLRVSRREGLPKVLLGQTSIQSLSLRGRGEIELCGAPVDRWFDLGAVRNLTTLHIKTDRLAYINIPATMHLQSLEMYAPAVSLSVEELYGWAKDVMHLRLVYGAFYWRCGNGGGDALRGSQYWPPGSPFQDDYERFLYTTFCEVRGGRQIRYHCERDDGSWEDFSLDPHTWRALQCMVLKDCCFDTGMAAATSVYNGGASACSCGICWMCLQPEKKD